MNIEQLKSAIEIMEILNEQTGHSSTDTEKSLNCMVGKKVIIRTYSAGVWFGELEQKHKNEVILKNARRMYRFWCKKSISLSAVAKWGVIHEKSKIVTAVDSVWLEAIEIIPCSDEAIESIESAPFVEQE